jgi:hypothetical protein
MFDALMTAVVADCDRACLVASFLPDEKAWSEPQRIRVEAEPEEPTPLTFDIRNSLNIAQMASRVQSLPVDEEVPGDEMETESDEIM